MVILQVHHTVHLFNFKYIQSVGFYNASHGLTYQHP